ncbi:T9SS type A sorting domain-containing protein, partial [bacterium]|nr:T9SS type A sorting domain-containing protein [bacterium]
IDYEKVALWTYYLGEKFGPSLIGQIVQQPENSVEGVRAALQTKGIALSFEDIFIHFVLANYLNNPGLDAQGYYGYRTITLPPFAPSGDFGSYPIDSQTKILPAFSSQYIRFYGQDSTAMLTLSSLRPADTRALILQMADQPRVEKLVFDSQGKTHASLKAIGQSVKNLVLTGVSLSGVNTFAYSVSTEIEDIKPPLITSGPQESIPGNNSITIIWKTDEYATSVVEYGLTAQYGRTARDSTLTTDHKIVLNQMATNTTYHYRVGSVDARDNGPTYSADFTFTTATPTGEPIVTLAQSHAYGYLGRSLAVDSDQTIHFLYHEKNGENRFIYHQKSADHGATWSVPVVVDQTCVSGGMPSVAVDSLHRVHVCWHAKATANSTYGIYYSRSDDGGSTWSRPQPISPPAADHDQLYSAIALDRQQNPHIVWNTALYSDYFEGDVYHAWSQDQGATWQPGSQISRSAFHHCFVPTIDFDSKGRCHVTYSDGRFEDQSLNAYYLRSDDGINWDNSVQISTSGVLYDGMIAMVVDAADLVHIAYADNYTPGDIRIMYTSVRSSEVAPPQAIAASSLGIEGHAFHPSLSRDDRGVIYLLYCDAPATAGLNKLNRAREEDIDALRWNRLLAAGAGDIYLSLSRNGIWLPGANVTSDAVDSQNPEMPNRQSGSDAVHLLWMSVQSETAHVARYARLNTRSVSSVPPRVVNRYPQADAVEVPYFSVYRLFADFDQRIVSDSLIPENVILRGEKSGTLSAVLTYLEDQKRLLISPVHDFQPEEMVTVRLRNHITNEAGLGLDGNGNGVDDGSPEDDVEWRFTTQARDTLAPTLAIGLLQHPVLSRYLSVYVKSREKLVSAPVVHIGEEKIAMSLLNAETGLYKGDYRLNSGGMMQLRATGTDLAGNEGRSDRNFAAALLTVAQGGVLRSTDGHVQLHVSAGALAEDAFASIVRIEPGDLTDSNANGENEPCYAILPEQMNGQIIFTQAVGGSGSPVIQRRDADGRWVDLATVREGDRLSASTPRMGVFRVTLSDQLPEQYQLSQNYPNPFSTGNTGTSFQVYLPQRQSVEIAVYNLLGEKVCTLLQGTLHPGVHRFTWNGRNASGSPLAAGLYFYRFSSRDCLLTKKMVILR